MTQEKLKGEYAKESKETTPRLEGDIDTSGGPINRQLDTDNAFSKSGLENARSSREALDGANFPE
ncbi:hypothetical protein [Peribacillus glennii]|uniref:Uncharacterized protein n=1 Tax=Peribacillus glennii TaxID=2303991 RepID=A0A372L915_9BACI|nr:hypothetical protein [Peribacillus glennii]RFU60973.1 hypothetical protein D0466_19795 [Peribacillus glennii]